MTFDSTHERWVDEAIYLVPHDPAWACRYAQVAQTLEPILRPWLTGGLHYVGSTAIPGLSAKPVVDVLVGVSSLAASRPCIELLKDAGWFYAPYRTDEMHWFCAPSPSRRDFHLHVAPTGGTWYSNELTFRDHLLANPDVTRAYEVLKVALAQRYPHDREAYTEGKTDFISQALRHVSDSPPTPPW